MKNEKPLLIIKSSRAIPTDSQKLVKKYLDDLDINSIFVGDAEVQYHQPISELVDAIKAQTDAINQLVLSNIEILDQLISEQENQKENDDDVDVEPPSLD
ncbi:hypothetical protein [Vibrio vulnificus]|uniref:hypothetical protein n=1 Tax=Vibrio vulnificus TaxID=672 RepID=UPI001FAE82B9|nr:hypothetical protein [Vibrio vulnificus]MCJ0804042.1 hypothetical protein [Vibrio vulnificus]